MSNCSGTSAPRGPEIPQPIADLIEQLQQRIEELEQDNDAQHNLIMRQHERLKKVANALRGEPDELSPHSHHDLIDVAHRLVRERDALDATVERLREVVKSAVSVFSKYEDDVDAYPTLEHIAFMETLKEQCK